MAIEKISLQQKETDATMKAGAKKKVGKPNTANVVKCMIFPTQKSDRIESCKRQYIHPYSGTVNEQQNNMEKVQESKI
jgi:hypothetical protein